MRSMLLSSPSSPLEVVVGVQCSYSSSCCHELKFNPPVCLRNSTSTSSSSWRSNSNSSSRSRRILTPHAIEIEGVNSIADAAASSSDLTPIEISWQIAVGSLAGIIPFIVAGIEFSKRIENKQAKPVNSVTCTSFTQAGDNLQVPAQKKCEICGGSGLLLKGDIYIRCPNCGGFLPWQSWRRFFTG